MGKIGMDKIIMEHGSGGRATGELIKEIFEAQFDSDVLSEMEDAAVVSRWRYRSSLYLRHG